MRPVIRSHPSTTKRNNEVNRICLNIQHTIGRSQRAYEDIVSKESSVVYENIRVSVGKLLETTPEILRGQRSFCWNTFRDPRDLPSFTLGEQLYAAFIPVSHPAHIKFSLYHPVAIPETVVNVALFNILKERGVVRGQSSLEAWKYVNGDKEKARVVAFHMEHSADLNESGFTILPRMAICKEVAHLELYYVDRGSELKRIFRGGFRSISEKFPRE